MLLPLVRFAPPLLRWRIRRRIYRWYDDVRDAETAARAGKTDDDRDHVLKELDRLQAEVGAIEVPLGYADQLYQLRLHIQFVRQLVTKGEVTEQAAPDP